MSPGAICAEPVCVGDCGDVGAVSAANLVAMVRIAAGQAEASSCPAGDGDGNGEVTDGEITEAIHGVFEDCGPVVYETLEGDLYDISYPTRHLSLAQAAAVLAALDGMGVKHEEELQALLLETLGDNGVQAERISRTAIYGQREQTCEECLEECVPRPPGRCIDGGAAGCFCLRPIEPDPAPLPQRIVILLLESPEDEPLAFDAFRIPCPPTVRNGGTSDFFSTANGPEPATPSQGLLTLMQQTSAVFDYTGKDRPFGHTFLLPRKKCLRGAKVIFRARPLSTNPSPGSRNDVAQLGFVDPSGQFVGPHWAAYFGTGNGGLPALLPKQWSPNNYPQGALFTLDLATVPGMVADLHQRRSLDIYVQDDTGVDYVSLVAYLCDCPTPTPTPTSSPTRTPTPTTTQPCAPPPPDMVAWWPLNETSGTSVADVAGTHHGAAVPGTIGGAGPLPSNLWPPPAYPNGVVGTSLFFSGTRHVAVPHDPALDPGTGDFTVDAWVIFTATGNSQELTIVRKILGNLGYKLIINDYPPPSSFPALSFETLGSVTGYNVNWPINPGSWHHIAATMQRVGTTQTVDLYLDGSHVMHYVAGSVGNIANNASLLIGGDGVAAGQIAVDEVEIFNRALTQAEVVSIYQAGTRGKCPLPTRTPTVTATNAPTSTPRPTSTPTTSPTRSLTPTVTVTPTISPSPSITMTPTRSGTPAQTATPTPTRTCVAPPAFVNMIAWWPLDEPPGATTVIDIGAPPANNGVPQPSVIDPFPPANLGPAAVAGNLVGATPDSALFFYAPTTYVEVLTPGSDLNLANHDLTIDAWFKPLPGPWTAARDDLHVYTVVDKLNVAGNAGYAFYVEVETVCPACPPIGQQPPPSGVTSTTTMRLVLALGNGATLTFHRSTAALFTGSGTLYPFPTPPGPLNMQPQGWTHIAVTVNRAQGTGRFYRDGQPLGGTFVPAAGLNYAGPLWIGGTRLYGTPQAPGFVEFTLNEIEVFRVALSQAEILAVAGAAAGKCKAEQSPTPTTLPSGTPTSSATHTPSRLPTSTPTRTSTSTPTRTPTATVATTPTRTPTATPTPTRSATPTPTVCIGGDICVFKFNDLDHDGVLDPGEPNLAGWTVNVASPPGNVVATLTTVSDACIGVDGQKSYTIYEVPQNGWTQSFPASGEHNVYVECGQFVSVTFGNYQDATATPTKTPNIPDVD